MQDGRERTEPPWPLLSIYGAILAGCAIFDFGWKGIVLITAMLFFPILDRGWRLVSCSGYSYRYATLIICSTGLAILVALDTDRIASALVQLLLVALPEEWFFRAYLMRRLEGRLGNGAASNLAVSLLFTLLHLPGGWVSIAVFVPSLVLGWLYQRTRDLVLIVLVHTLFNLVYIYYLREFWLDWWDGIVGL